MQTVRRKLLLSLLALPAGCAFQPLPALRTQAAAAPAVMPAIRPPALGQRWTYRRYNGYNSALLATETDEVVALAPQVLIRRRSDAPGAPVLDELQQPWGRVQRELAWDHVQTYEEALPLWPAEPRPGARSVQRTHYRVDGFSYRYWISLHTQVVGWEHLTLGAHDWLALRVERFIRLQHHDVSRLETTRRDTLWLVPEIGRWAAREISGEYLAPDDPGLFRGLEEHQRWELQAWS